MRQILKTVSVITVAVAAAGVIAALVVRDQMDRHRRSLFSPNPLRRLACLGHLAQAEATVDNITLLRDYVAWERRDLLKSRAKVILKRMEDQASEARADALPQQG
jgi:hypothetical protein